MQTCTQCGDTCHCIRVATVRRKPLHRLHCLMVGTTDVCAVRRSGLHRNEPQAARRRIKLFSTHKVGVSAVSTAMHHASQLIFQDISCLSAQ